MGGGGLVDHLGLRERGKFYPIETERGRRGFLTVKILRKGESGWWKQHISQPASQKS